MFERAVMGWEEECKRNGLSKEAIDRAIQIWDASVDETGPQSDTALCAGLLAMRLFLLRDKVGAKGNFTWQTPLLMLQAMTTAALIERERCAKSVRDRFPDSAEAKSVANMIREGA